MGKIRFKRGKTDTIPTLEYAEPGFTTDTERLFIGTNTGNKELAMVTDVEQLSNDIIGELQPVTFKQLKERNEAFSALRLGYVDKKISPVIERVDNVESSLADMTTNVKTFGAKGDGVTDDTQSIKTAFVKAVNGTIYFPNGTYIISELIEVPPNTSVKGQNKDKTVIMWDEKNLTPSVMFRLSVNSEAQIQTVSDISFNGKRTERNLIDDESNAALIPRNRAIIERVNIMNTVGPGITSSNGVDNIIIRDCNISDTGHHAIYFSTGGTYGGYVTNIRVYRNKISYPQNVVRGFSVNNFKLRFDKAGDKLSNIFVSDNEFSTTTSNSVAVYLSTTTGNTKCIFEKIEISRNTINKDSLTTNLISDGIYVGSNSTANEFLIDHNIINGNSTGSEATDTYGIRCLLDGENQNVKVSNNIIKKVSIGISGNTALVDSNYVDFYKYGAVLLYDSKCTRNQFISQKDNAIGVYRPTADVSENIFTLTGLNSFGITLTDTTRKFITRNKINNAVVGIQRVNGKILTDCVIADNSFNSVTTNYQNIDAATQLNNLFEPSLVERVATTATRPIGKFVGERLFDSTLGKPIWWNGTAWKDATGTTV